MRGSIFATSPEGIIGVGNAIPWRHPGDQRRFKRVTLGTAVVMGRLTFESMAQPLGGRRNIVVTRQAKALRGAETARSIDEALELVGAGDVWFIGGARIYQEAMRVVDVIDVTYVPDRITAEHAVFAPRIDDAEFEAGPLLPHEDEPTLTRRVYTRRRS